MRRDVSLDSIAKNVIAEKTFEHSQERFALLVGDIVKRAVGLAFRFDALLNRMRGGACVSFHCCFLGDAWPPCRISRQFARKPDFPLRIKMCGALAAHP